MWESLGCREQRERSTSCGSMNMLPTGPMNMLPAGSTPSEATFVPCFSSVSSFFQVFARRLGRPS